MDTNVRTGVKNWCELLPFLVNLDHIQIEEKMSFLLGGAVESFD